MGTTVTANLSLIKPDDDEQIKSGGGFAGWAVQNGLNCDAIDGLFRHTNTHTWTPTWTADSVNPTLGAGGSTDGKYIRLFPRMVLAYFRIFTGGAGFATGTGLYRISLPVAVPSEFATHNNALAIGKAYLHDDSAVATSSNMVVLYDIGSNLINFRKHDGNFWRDNTPFTLAQNDRVSGYFMYPTAAA